ncbi:MAG: tRNA lysidine(34) synthetase TilS [Acidobacteria bacterium]|nr:tRNA lysidine(34) synthetase TilS [Acidobacteriota bacterium]
MDRFPREFVTEWRKLELPFKGERAVVAVSGGADSVSLLLVLSELARRRKITNELVVAHFDHGLRGEESLADAEFVRELAGSLGYEFELGHGRIAKKGNLEQNARLARYAFLAKTAERHKAFAVLTAHTLNDQAETFLLNLIRGSGPEGLVAMRPIRPLEGTKAKLVRPMLRWAKRDETEEFCFSRGINFRTDAMNRDPRFTRVRIRTELLPILKTFNPKIVEQIARTASLMPAAEGESAYAAAGENDASELRLALLRKMDGPGLRNTLRQWIKANRGSLRGITHKHIEGVERLVRSEKSGKMAELPAGAHVRKGSGKLFFELK